MPHQCTNCGRTFPDGSKEMLSGCPDCGGNKFQFHPGSVSDDAQAAETDASSTSAADLDPDAAPDPEPDAATDGLASKANASVRDWVRGRTADAPDDSSAPSASPRPPSPPDVDDTEDTAQADARRDVVTPDELAEAADAVPSDEAATDPADDAPDLADLRAELNEQFESIRIVDRGQYELNLMELYDREEYIISLQEDGRYVIEVSEPWRDD
ncbi:Zn-ribbon domain-containing protein [Haloplanus sp. GCM10025708]|uniref:Zn-ribbon domain-containing protein n=1 Tax=Haloferacaceae TaxID=1644056 RepID=UPI003615B364